MSNRASSVAQMSAYNLGVTNEVIVFWHSGYFSQRLFATSCLNDSRVEPSNSANPSPREEMPAMSAK
jgi:hypothetical protein